jgi:DhnA family fructose-bisphosphate aldolase class Ia
MGLARGWESPAQTLEKIVAGGPDGIMTTYGILKQFRHLLAPHMGLILRIDGGATIFREKWNEYTRWRLLFSIDAAVRLGVDAVICMGYFGSECELETVEIICRVAAEAATAGLPVAVEALPVPGPTVKNPYDAELVATAARLAAEYGADMIKTYYTGSAESFARVTSCCPVPVLIAGGEVTATDRGMLEALAGAMRGGARGAFIGRNIWQHRDPAAMIQALSMVVHEDCSVDAALDVLTSRA